MIMIMIMRILTDSINSQKKTNYSDTEACVASIMGSLYGFNFN